MAARAVSTIVLLVLVIELAGCGSSLQGRRLQGVVKSEEAKGIAYSLSRPRFSISRKTHAAGKKARPQLDLVVSYEPDPDRRFEVGMTPGWIASDTFDLTLNDKGVASALNSSRTDETFKTVAGLLEVAGAAAGVAAEAMKSRAGIKTALRELQTAQLLTEAQVISFETFLEKCPLSPLQLSRKQQLDVKLGTASGNTPEHDELTQLTAKLDECVSLAKELEPIVSAVIGELVDGKEGIRVKASELPCPFPGLGAGEVDVKRENTIETKSFQVEQLEELQQTIKLVAGTAQPDVATIVAKQRKAVAVALAKAVENPSDRAARDQLEKSIKQLHQSVALIVEADDSLQRRALGTRREQLIAFLKAPVPSSGKDAKQHAEAYQLYQARLAEVDSALQSVIPVPAQAPDPDDIALGTDVTSTVAEGVVVDRWPIPLPPDRVRARIRLAKARIRYGCAAAVVIVMPFWSEEAAAVVSSDTRTKDTSGSSPPASNQGGAGDSGRRPILDPENKLGDGSTEEVRQ